jgi:hypothetical protein
MVRQNIGMVVRGWFKGGTKKEGATVEIGDGIMVELVRWCMCI